MIPSYKRFKQLPVSGSQESSQESSQDDLSRSSTGVGFNPSQSTQSQDFFEGTTPQESELPSDSAISNSDIEALCTFEKLLSEQLRSLYRIELSNPHIIKLSEVFLKLANIKIRRGELTEDISCYTDSAKRLKYLDAILSNLQENHSGLVSSHEIEALRDIYKEKIIQLHRAILSLISINSVSEDIFRESEDVLSHKDEIREIREYVSENINGLGARLYVKEISEEISKRMNKYLANLFQDAEQVIGSIKHEYSVIGLGSMPLGQMTPYSDLEFAILTKDESYKDSLDPKVSNYFKNISHYVNFKIILLGETVIPMSEYNINLTNIGQGVQFDLGGKTPLGRSDKPYELVQIIENMMGYLRNEGRKQEYIDKILPYILEKSCFVYGSDELVNEYHDTVKKFLLNEEEGTLQSKKRTVSMLSSDAVELNYAGKKNIPQQIQIKAMLKEFQCDLREYKIGMKFDVKNEIYRLADRFIYSLSLICGVVTPSMNLWSSIESMVDKKFINQKAGENLTAALSFANILRLKFYDHCGQQAKHLDIITESRKKGVFADGELSEDGIFFRFYYVLIPLIRSLEDFTYAFIAGNDVKEFFKENDFYDDNEWIKGTIYGRLLNYQSAQRCFEGSLKDLPECFDSANKLCYVANIYQQLGEYLEAINLYQKAVAIYEKTHTKVADIEIAKCREKMGMVYLACEDFEKAYDEYSKSLEIYENYNEQERIASSYDDFSSLCRTTSKKYPALSISQKAADIRKTLQEKTENHLSSAVSLMNLGMAYHDVGYYEKAFRKVTRALNTLESEYSIQHPDVGICIKNLGTILRSMGKYEEALERHNQAFNILKKETDIAACMNDIGLDLLALSKNYYALQMFEQVREAYTTIYGSSHHLVASCINNIGKVFDNADMYYWAICNYYSAFLMMKESYGSEDRSSFNDCLSHVAEIYYKFGMKREAVTILENVVESLNKKFKYSSHPNIATLLERIGNIYEKLGDEKEAWIKYDQAVEICEYFMENDKSHSKHHLKDFYSRILPCCKTSNLDMEVEVTGEKIIELDSNF